MIVGAINDLEWMRQTIVIDSARWLCIDDSGGEGFALCRYLAATGNEEGYE